MCRPAPDRLSRQAGGNHVLRMPFADYSPPGDSQPLETSGVRPSAFCFGVLARTVFDAGRRRASPKSTRANYDAAVATYRQTSLTPFQQVEDKVAPLQQTPLSW